MKLTRTVLVVLLISCAFNVVAQEPKPHLLPPPETLLALEPEFVTRHYLIKSGKPKYSEEAQKAGVQGKVLAFVWFDKDGKLVEAKVLSSPDELLSNAVLSALREWRISPHAPLFPDANYMSEFRFVFSLKDGNADVMEAEKSEQEKVSSEFRKEIETRRKNSSK